MRFRKRILIALLVVAGVLAIGFSPIITANVVRGWIWWKAHQEKLSVKIDKIDAPFLRPIVLRNIHITSTPGCAFRLDVRATQAIVDLNFKSILLRTRGRTVQDLSVSGLRVELHRNASGQTFPDNTWATWEKLLPNSASIDAFDLRIEDGVVVVLFRGGKLSLNDVEAGRIAIDEVTISSPFLRQTFSQLHGATRWQDNRLTLAGLSLARGLDAPSITIDLSHLRKQRLGLVFDLDTFGGKLRADISSEWRSNHSNWTIAGSAADISLAQTGNAIGLADRIAGRLHAGKFTFRGDLRDPMNATASVWTELSAPAWRKREADVLMFGLALYNRQLDVQQFYVKQKKNELTLSGEAPLPTTAADWLNLDFRGNISASIANLGEFAALFGAKPAQFAGQITVDGTVSARGKKVGGEMSATGKSLLLFGSPVDALAMQFHLDGSEVEIAELNLQRKEDFLRAQGKIDILDTRKVAGSLEVAVKKLADYFEKPFYGGALSGHFEVNGRMANCDSLQLTDNAIKTSLRAAVDFSDPAQINVTFTPLAPLFDLSAIAPTNCITEIKLATLSNSTRAAPGITKLDLRGDFANGVREIHVTTAIGEKEFRLSCDENPGTLSLGVGPAQPH
ncbi:MAG: hypothetical protein ABJB69_00620 [Spartobacteria bacterium]